MHSTATGLRAPCRALAGLAGLVLSAATALSGTGGPDFYGYTWRDSLEPGVTFAWEDITATGIDVTMRADDRNSGLRPLPFPFPYRGADYTRIARCTNGWVSLVDGGADSYDNLLLPEGGPPRGTIAAFWDDFNLENAGEMFIQDLGDRYVVTWQAIPFFRDETQTATFQVILHADGRIVVQLLAITGTLDSATIGIESVDDTDGLTAWFNGPIPAPPYAVWFEPPPPLPNGLDCAGAAPLACGDVVTADLAAAPAGQPQYRCTRDDLSGREHVYVVDLPTPTSVRYVLEPLSGNPRLLTLPACDPNACTVVTGGLLSLNGATGRFYLVVESAPGEEGAYRLRAECLPLATSLDCSAPAPLACGETVTGDLAAGAANQDSYWCSLDDWGGSEQVWLLDFPVQVSSATVTLNPLGGNPQLIAIYPCDANACLAPPGLSFALTDPVGPYFVVVDCAAGEEGAYELVVTGGAPPSRDVAGALRASGATADTVNLSWPAFGAPRAGESFAVMRADDDPTGPWLTVGRPGTTAWTDPAAPPRYAPTHVWFYDVRVSDPCGNLSAD